MFWWCLALVAVLIAMKYVPVCYSDLIEGEFLYKRPAKDFFSDINLTVYHFKNYCKSCLEGNIRIGGIIWNCHETIPTNIWTIGALPKEKEVVKLTVYYNIYGTMIIAKWTRTEFKLNPIQIQLTKNKIDTYHSKRKICSHS